MLDAGLRYRARFVYPPTARDFDRVPWCPSSRTVINEFGRWSAFLTCLGMPVDKRGGWQRRRSQVAPPQPDVLG